MPQAKPLSFRVGQIWSHSQGWTWLVLEVRDGGRYARVLTLVGPDDSPTDAFQSGDVAVAERLWLHSDQYDLLGGSA